MPRRTTKTARISTKDLIEIMATASREMIERKCPHAPKDEPTLNVDCDDCIRTAEIDAMREHIANALTDEDDIDIVLGRAPIVPKLIEEPMPEPGTLRVKLERHKGYSGWFYDVDYPHEKRYPDGTLRWGRVTHGYAITHVGAQFAIKKAARRWRRRQQYIVAGKFNKQYTINVLKKESA